MCENNGYSWDEENAGVYVSPSTISSESSRKNSLSGGLLGRLSVFSSCWILVDTLLLTGTPVQTSRETVTNIYEQTAKHSSIHPHMQLYATTTSPTDTSKDQDQRQEGFEREICTGERQRVDDLK